MNAAKKPAVTALAAGLVLALAAPITQAATTQRDRDLAEIGDYVQIALPAAGYIGAWLTGDKQGALQLTKVIGSSTIAAHTFKMLGERGRPDASDNRSFPSGHTTASFAGSEYIRQRYGNAWGIPATIAAAFVGYTRVRANKHFRDDVLAGMSNGLLWNWYFTTPRDDAVSLRPAKMEDGGYGVEFSYNFDTDRVYHNRDYTAKPKFTYNLEYGPVTQDTNLFINPIATGFNIDLATAEDEFDITSRVTFEHYFADRHEWGLFIAPMELIEFDPSRTLTGPAEFAGKTFLPEPDTSFEARYNLIDARAVYRYRLVDNDRWQVRVGAGIQYLETTLDVTQFRGNPKDNDVVEFGRAQIKQKKAIASLRAEYAFNERWRLAGHLDGYGGSDQYANAALVLNWRAAAGWDIGFGFRYIDREMSDGDIYNKLEAGDFVLSVTHGFFE